MDYEAKAGEFLKLALVACQRVAVQNEEEPQPGDLVVEVTNFAGDVDGIGWLVYHGEAPFFSGGKNTREVWDIVPLSGQHKAMGRKWQRWENAEFKKVPVGLLSRSGLTRPPALDELLAQSGDE